MLDFSDDKAALGKLRKRFYVRDSIINCDLFSLKFQTSFSLHRIKLLIIVCGVFVVVVVLILGSSKRD